VTSLFLQDGENLAQTPAELMSFPVPTPVVRQVRDPAQSFKNMLPPHPATHGGEGG